MTVTTYNKLKIATGFALLALPALPAIGQELTIDWGTDFFPAGPIVTSSGEAITLGDGSFTDGGFTIELGAFDNSFVPTASNVGDWVNDWRVFDAIVADDLDGNDNLVPSLADPSLATFAGQDLLDSSNLSLSVDSIVDEDFVFEQGLQAYVFIRNNNNPEPGSEWLLYTRDGEDDAWRYPFVAPETHSPADDLEWFVQQANTAVFGGVNGTTIGAGEREFTDETILAQTFTFVPEPSSALLTGLGALVLMRRRR